jgi:pimeloyl-ACP methyl ester carboxylesterase
MPYLAAPGVMLHYRVSGDGPPLVLIHGFIVGYGHLGRGGRRPGVPPPLHDSCQSRQNRRLYRITGARAGSGMKVAEIHAVGRPQDVPYDPQQWVAREKIADPQGV